MRTSSCKALLLIHWMFKQFAAAFHVSSRRPKSGLARHSEQIVILVRAKGWLDGFIIS
jgi:hypothetical protein